jgi:hypothetical protein
MMNFELVYWMLDVERSEITIYRGWNCQICEYLEKDSIWDKGNKMRGRITLRKLLSKRNLQNSLVLFRTTKKELSQRLLHPTGRI